MDCKDGISILHWCPFKAQTDMHKQTNRHTDRQTDRGTDRQKDGQACRQAMAAAAFATAAAGVAAVGRSLSAGSPAAGEMVQMMAVLELPPRLACSIRVSLLSLNGTWLRPCMPTCVACRSSFIEGQTDSKQSWTV